MQRSLAILALALASPAAAQEILFEDDFEQGLGNWTSIQMSWYVTDVSDPCAATLLPFPSGTHAARFGDPDCTYEVAFVGWLTLVQPVHLPADAIRIDLTHWSYESTECTMEMPSGAGCGYDFRSIYVSTDGGATWEGAGYGWIEDQWHQRAYDLTPWRGSDVLIRFVFNSVDTGINNLLGWILDDVRIVKDNCLAVTNYCTGAPNSAFPGGARMGYAGSRRVHLNSFSLTVDDAPPGQFAHLFYGSAANQVPVADGFLCVGAGPTTITRLFPSGQIDSAGHLERPLDLEATEYTPNWILAGSTWYFQCWFRDPTGGAFGSNFSDGLEVTFCP